MDVSPQSIRSTAFKSARKGYDPDEVNAFKERVAAAVELAQNQATSMEARARAAVAKLQELSQQHEQAASRLQTPAEVIASSGDAETISRALLLAQRTADSTIATARSEAERMLAEADAESATILAVARSSSNTLLEEGRSEARRASEAERVAAENELQSLLARRDFLLADVDQLEQYLVAQRERLRDAAVSLQDLVERVPGGLGEMRRPLMSASAEPAAHHPESTSSAAAMAVGDAPDPVDASRLAQPDLDPTQAMDRPEANGDSASADDTVTQTPAQLDVEASAADADATPPESTLLTGRLDANDVWRMVDQDPPLTKMPTLSFDEVTGEVPTVQQPPADGFHIAGEDLR
jgi:DivIVA domain-containing protein